MSGHVHLLYSDTTLCATLQRQLQAAFFHVTACAGDEQAAHIASVRATAPEVVALVRSPSLPLARLAGLKQYFSHQAIVLIDSIPSSQAKAAALQHGADAYLELPMSGDDLTLHLTAQIRQARRLDDAGSTEGVLRLLGFDPMMLAVHDASILGAGLVLSHEDQAFAASLLSVFNSVDFEPKLQPCGQPLQLDGVSGAVLGAVSTRGWQSLLAAVAACRSTSIGRHIPIIIAAPTLPAEVRDTVSRLDIQAFWLGVDPDFALTLQVKEHVRRYQQSQQRREALVQSLDLAITDSLTGLFNKRFLMAHLPVQMQIARQSRRSLSLALLDLDGFKGLNDSFGHLAGDQFLISVADRLRQNSRVSDSAIRLGGDEFALVLPNAHAGDARKVLARLIDGIASISHAGSDDNRTPISASAGLVTLEPDDWSSTTEALIAEADSRLYAAKKKGGNQIMDTASS